MRQDSPLGVTPLDITGYHPPWKQLTDFALRPDPDHGGPHFNALVSQVNTFTYFLNGFERIPWSLFALLTIQIVCAAEPQWRVFSEKIIVCWLKNWSAKISANSKQICFQKILFIAAQQQKLLGSSVVIGSLLELNFLSYRCRAMSQVTAPRPPRTCTPLGPLLT